MTLQITKDSFIHDGRTYLFADVGYILYQAEKDRAIVSMKETQHYAAITIQTIHTSALMLAYARWVFYEKR